MRSAPKPHLSAPAGPVTCGDAAVNGPAHRCQDGHRISIGQDRRVRRKGGPQLGCGSHQLRPSTHHSWRPVSGHVEQRLACQPVTVVQQFSDIGAIVCGFFFTIAYSEQLVVAVMDASIGGDD